MFLNRRSVLRPAICVVLCGLLATSVLAGKGNGKGNGGSGGSGSDPVLPPVRYSVMLVAMPDTSYFFNDCNESGAIVGWTMGVGSKRGFAYLPSVNATTAIDLTDPAFGVQGVPDGWFVSSAVGINNRGDIAGYLEPIDGEPYTNRRGYFLDMSGEVPQLTPLPAVNSDPWQVVEDINDSGDMVIATRFTDANGQTTVSVYGGNPGLYGNPVVPFTRLDIGGLGFGSTDALELSNRTPLGTAIITGETDSGLAFRASLDSSWHEIAEPSVDSTLSMVYARDINDFGDVAGTGSVPLKKKRGWSGVNEFAAIWKIDTNTISAIGNSSPEESIWWTAAINNAGDAVLRMQYASSPDYIAIWHDDWSLANGAVFVTDLLDPNDADSQYFHLVHEMTDRDPATDFPILIGQGESVVDGVTIHFPMILIPQPAP